MNNKLLTFLKRQPRWRLAVGGTLLLAIGIWFFNRGPVAINEITFVVKRGDLQISVLEGGSIEALQSQEIRSEVKGSTTKILKIVEEGYQVTEDDVKNGKVLVELDSSDIKSRMIQQEIQYQSAVASLTEARQSYEIQRNQNMSTIKAAEQKSQFAKMDLQKFLGDNAYAEVVRTLRLDKLEAVVAKLASAEDIERVMLTAMETNEVFMAEEFESRAEDYDEPQLTPVSNTTARKPTPAPLTLDYSKFANEESLGDGSAMQQLRKLNDEMQTARQQLSLATSKRDGTRRLQAKGFATKTELDTDEINFNNNQLKVKTAETAYKLFIKYEFEKQAQELASKYEESLRGLEREKKEAVSRLAQANARLKGAESRYSIEVTQRKEWMDQLDKCVIKALKPGLVVYGGSSEGGYSGYEQIREGASVRERQPLITIPDMNQMAVRVKIHESYIQKVQKGLKAVVQADAFPDRKLSAEVTKVALLPDSQNRWVNPDLKVYQTMVSIEGGHEWLKPGMSAKVEILVKHLTNVVYIPLQSVSEMGGKHFCYVADVRVEMREVEVGSFNDEFIEIKHGLEEGEDVLLRAPVNTPDKPKKKKSDSPEPPPTPAAESTSASVAKSAKPRS
jgi:HlyD family secretion protein